MEVLRNGFVLIKFGVNCAKRDMKKEIKTKIRKLKGKLYIRNQWWGSIQVELDKMKIGELLELSCENRKWLVIRRK